MNRLAQGRLGLFACQVLSEDPLELLEVAPSCRITSGLGVSEITQMHVFDAGNLKPLGQGQLREAKLSRDRYVPNINQHVHLRNAQRRDKISDRCPLVSYREKCLHPSPKANPTSWEGVNHTMLIFSTRC